VINFLIEFISSSSREPFWLGFAVPKRMSELQYMQKAVSPSGGWRSDAPQFGQFRLSAGKASSSNGSWGCTKGAICHRISYSGTAV
jgi:hypothetical protein